MDSAALIRCTRGSLALVTAREAVLEHNFAHLASSPNLSGLCGGGGSPSPCLPSERRRTSNLSTATVGVYGGRKKFCVQAVETSSRPKGARRQVYVEPQWLVSSNGNGRENNLGGEVATAADERNEESPSGRSWPSIATTTTERQKKKHDDDDDALYYIEIRTANGDRSSLSEPSAGIMLAMIGENRKSILHTVPGVLEQQEDSRSYFQEGGLVEEEAADDRRPPRASTSTGGRDGGSLQQHRFQRGATDILTIAGPDLGRLAALWIAPKAGTWKVEKASVTILPSWTDGTLVKKRRSEGDEPGASDKREWKGLFHLFESNEALLGKDAWLAATELKPSVIREVSDVSALQDKLLLKSSLGPSGRSLESERVARLRQESMKEYQGLKLSLLGFSSLLVAAGTSALAVLGQGKLAEGFAVGGIGGFLYLLLLQRAVDQLPSSSTAEFSLQAAEEDKSTSGGLPQEEGMDSGESLAPEQDMTTKRKMLESSSSKIINLPPAANTGVRIGLPGRIALVAGLTLTLGRLAGGGAVSTISSGELLAGVIGFLSSKVAVVLAALKPTASSNSSEDK